jgi:hypothetical protein
MKVEIKILKNNVIYKDGYFDMRAMLGEYLDDYDPVDCDYNPSGEFLYFTLEKREEKS